MTLSTNKQQRNIRTMRKHQKQAKDKFMKYGRRIMREALATIKGQGCGCPDCKPPVSGTA
jgi:tRNA G18 (ribose-2'-O)-methylase SpoU